MTSKRRDRLPLVTATLGLPRDVGVESRAKKEHLPTGASVRCGFPVRPGHAPAVPHHERGRRPRPRQPNVLHIHLRNHDFAVGVDEMNRNARRADALASGQAIENGVCGRRQKSCRSQQRRWTTYISDTPHLSCSLIKVVQRPLWFQWTYSLP
jgi:hypothetical protein